MTFAQIIPPEPDPEPRVWGARSLDRSYRLDCEVRALTMDLVPDWLLFQLDGSGPFTSAWSEWLTGATIVRQARRRGFEITEGTLTEVDDAGFRALVPAVQIPEPAPLQLAPEDFVLTQDDFTARAPRPARKRKRRR